MIELLQTICFPTTEIYSTIWSIQVVPNLAGADCLCNANICMRVCVYDSFSGDPVWGWLGWQMDTEVWLYLPTFGHSTENVLHTPLPCTHIQYAGLRLFLSARALTLNTCSVYCPWALGMVLINALLTGTTIPRVGSGGKKDWQVGTINLWLSFDLQKETCN